MTAAVYRNGTPALSVPQTQNTAPVLEFNCLYTHDIRRKAKRWQDGFLRYHTFNKRVMVYDVPRNYIGDTHWTSDGEVADGDELTLDKAGVLVQVAEAVGRTETDLTELRASTKKARADGSSPARASQTSNAAVFRQPHQLKHRSLNALLGTSRTSIGKAALPTKSPFELRHENVENEAWEEGRPPKRQRRETSEAQDVARSTTAHKAASSELPLWARTADAANQRKKAQLQPVQQKVGTRQFVNLREDDSRSRTSLPGFSSDTLAPSSSPPRQKALIQRQPTNESSSPAFRTQKMPPKPRNESLSKLAAAESQDTAAEDDIDHAFMILDDSDDHDSAAQSRKSPIKTCVQSNRVPKLPERAHCSPSAASDRPQSRRPGSTLRVAARTNKKKGLLCQDQLTSQPKRISSTNTEAAADRLIDATSDDEGHHPKRQSGFVVNRLARIRKKEAAAARRSKVFDKQVEKSADSARPGEIAPGRSCAGINGSLTDMPVPLVSGSNSAIELAELDRMILPPAIAAPDTRSTNDNTEASPVLPRDYNVRQDGDEAVLSLPQPPAQSMLISDRDVPKSGPADGSLAKPKRLPGAPMRFTPSPPKALRQAASTTAIRQAAGLNERAASPSGEVAVLNQPASAMPSPGRPGSREGMQEAPSLDQRDGTPSVETAVSNRQAPVMPPPPKPGPREGLQKAVSLNTAASDTATVMLGRPFQPPRKTGVLQSKMAHKEDEIEFVAAPTIAPAPAEPWSREAFDLFGWRPPGWDEEGWCFGKEGGQDGG
ncbi:hypothetical protein EJ03DRAFT_320984 [Teratosphaeria nubilosa]|uniref:5'-3' DNA helicase ZGRF1-like N-terminal domain-containing protein n=1 Tax=Teratosphaeria nubilosa TaxID=161662 RepID=A0A6G1KV71_9PEZI|nr:hypothetical protein EJ03DRAFT_320984 [Teratosphaeria nubilosa]